MASTPRTTPSDDEVINALKVLKASGPKLGVQKVLQLLREEHPDWLMATKRVRELASGLGPQPETSIPSSTSEPPQRPVYSIGMVPSGDAGLGSQPVPRAPAKPISGGGQSMGGPSSEAGVRGVLIFCEMDKHQYGYGLFHETVVPPSDPIFKTSPMPVSIKIGIPILMRPYNPSAYLMRSSQYDCQPATYLAIDVQFGLAPPKWQSSVGTCLVVRQDRKPLSERHLEVIWDYHSRILDAFGNSARSGRAMMTQPKFEAFTHSYAEEQGDPAGSPQWSPFAV